MKIAVAGGTGTVGAHTTRALREAGHDVVVMSRSTGVDLRRDSDVARALVEVDVIVDTANAPGLRRSVASSYFRDASRRFQRLGDEAGVQQLVTLSIVGIDRVPHWGYYEAKVAQEVAANDGPIPSWIVRATQFHEFPYQLMERMTFGPWTAAFRANVQPVAARTVGQHLALCVTEPAHSGLEEIGGPQATDLLTMARAMIAASGQRRRLIPVYLPRGVSARLRGGALLPVPSATLAGPTFGEWLKSEDFGELMASRRQGRPTSRD